MDFRKGGDGLPAARGSVGPLSRRGMDTLLCLLLLALILESVRRGLICEEYLEDTYIVFAAMAVGMYFFRRRPANDESNHDARPSGAASGSFGGAAVDQE